MNATHKGESGSGGSIHRRIAEHARTMHTRPVAEADMVAVDLVEAAVTDIPGVAYAGITVVKKRSRVDTAAATHRYPEILDDIQNRHQQGPFLASQWDHHLMRVPDLAAETRWPDYCRDALAATPVKSILSFELFNGDEILGTLNVFADDANAFNSDTEDIGIVFATHAALAWSSVRQEHQFSSALASRDIIGQAKGILMERYRNQRTTSLRPSQTAIPRIQHPTGPNRLPARVRRFHHRHLNQAPGMFV